MNKNAPIGGRWDASRKLGNHNQYNELSESWKAYERAYGFQEKVSASLDAAVQNGYELMDWAAEDIAIDLHEYDAYFEKIKPLALVPYIQNWKGAQDFLKEQQA